MKQLIQKLIEPFGYTFRRIDSLKPYNPFVRNFEFPGANFRMWISNRDVSSWYASDLGLNSGEFYALQNLVKPGDNVLEIGSHHGFTGLYLSRFVGENGRVFGLEANPSNALIDQAQMVLNGFKNLQFKHAAASDKPGNLKISSNHNAAISNDGTDVEAITGDMLDAQFGPFNVLKVDVEGYEVEVLRGCREILKRSPKLAIEIHNDEIPKRGHSLDDLLDLIDAEKYQGEMIVRPKSPTDRIPFSISALKSLKRDPNLEYLAVNVFLVRK